MPYTQQRFPISLTPTLPAIGASTSEVDPIPNADTPATAGEIPELAENILRTETISLQSPNNNTSNGSNLELLSDPLPVEIERAIAYAFQQQAVDVFLFIGPGILQSALGASDIDPGTWLCIRFLDQIPGIPGEIVIVSPKAPHT